MSMAGGIYVGGGGPYLPLVGGRMTGDIQMGANSLRTTDHLLQQEDAAFLQLRNALDTLYSNLRLNQLGVGGGIFDATGGAFLNAFNSDNQPWIFNCRDNGVGLIEVARLQGAADPYFQATLPMRILPVATGALPGTPVEGMLAYDGTVHKLKVYTGAGWETVVSA